MSGRKNKYKAKKAATKKCSNGMRTDAREFTAKQQRFIDCYDGDVKKAAKKAKITYQYARRLATKSNILKAIRERENTEVRPKTIATRQKRQEFWTETMDDEEQTMKDRLRASELLGKSEADFTDNINNKFPEGIPKLKIVIEK